MSDINLLMSAFGFDSSYYLSTITDIIINSLYFNLDTSIVVTSGSKDICKPTVIVGMFNTINNFIASIC